LLVLVQDVHFRGFAHRDIKSEHVLITPDKRVHLAGWRTAGKLPFAEPCGSPPYMAPEVFLAEEYDNKCDVWSVGVLAYVMATKSLPFSRPTLSETLQAVASAEPDLSHPALTPPLKDFLRRTLNKVGRRCG
jgi:serine/threonine protein kinase